MTPRWRLMSDVLLMSYLCHHVAERRRHDTKGAAGLHSGINHSHFHLRRCGQRNQEPRLKPPCSIFRLSEGSGAGKHQPRELKSSFCLRRPWRPLSAINFTALYSNHKHRGVQKSESKKHSVSSHRSKINCPNLWTFYTVE